MSNRHYNEDFCKIYDNIISERYQILHSKLNMSNYSLIYDTKTIIRVSFLLGKPVFDKCSFKKYT